MKELEKLLNKYCIDKNQNIILCEDLNINYLSNSDIRNELVDLLQSYDVNILVDEPTRFATNSFSAIDYMCTNFEINDYEILCNVSHNGLSDHTSQIMSMMLSFEQNSDNLVYTRMFSNANYNNFYRYLSKENWVDVYECKSVNDGFEKCVNIKSLF